MFIVPTIIGTEPPCSSARKKDVERNRHSFPLTKIVAVLLFIEEIYAKVIDTKLSNDMELLAQKINIKSPVTL